MQDLFYQNELKSLLESKYASSSNQEWTPPLFVFINACHSEECAKVFYDPEQGVSHVIAVEQNKALLDCAGVTFTRAFYRSLFSTKNRYNICAAFKQAKEIVVGKHPEVAPSAYKKYPETQLCEQCKNGGINLGSSLLQRVGKGDIIIERATHSRLIQSLPSDVIPLIGRQNIMLDVIQTINSN